MQRAHNDNKEKIACAIFAGGQNLRMGRHKAFLDHRGRQFIEVIRDNMSAWFSDVFIVTNDRKLFPGVQEHVFEDIIPGKGPLGALYTALTATKKQKVFCVACDMPFSNSSVMSRLIRESEKEGFDCFVPAGEKGPEPLFAIYTTDLRELARREISTGQLSLSRMLEKCRTKYIDIENEKEQLININTPEEYDRYAGKIKDMA